MSPGKSMICGLACLAMLQFSSCGDGGAGNGQAPAGDTGGADLARTAITQSITQSGSGPVMPNVDETEVQAVSDSALAAYEKQWGDGSGAFVVWGPNIVSGWALMGVENDSGAAAKDVLLHQENGAWQVKDMGKGLAAKWEGQTPPGFWPTV